MPSSCKLIFFVPDKIGESTHLYSGEADRQFIEKLYSVFEPGHERFDSTYVNEIEQVHIHQNLNLED
jgi:hypothetical protein